MVVPRVTTLLYSRNVGGEVHGMREAIRKKSAFLLDIVEKWSRPPPPILDIGEVTFVLTHFGPSVGSFCKGPTFKYLPY